MTMYTELKKVPNADDLFEGLEEDYPTPEDRLRAVVHLLDGVGLFDRVREELLAITAEMREMEAAEVREAEASE